MIHTARRLRSWCKWQTSKRDLRWRSPTTWWTTYRSSSPTNLPWIVGIFLSSTSKFTAYVYSCTCWAFPTSWDPLVSWLSTAFSPRRRRRTLPRSTRCNWTQFPRYFMVSGDFAVDNLKFNLLFSLLFSFSISGFTSVPAVYPDRLSYGTSYSQGYWLYGKIPLQPIQQEDFRYHA